MLFSDFCEKAEKLMYPIYARNQIVEMLGDNPVLICRFLMGDPLEKKIGISRKTVGNILSSYGVNIDDYANPGEAAAQLKFRTTQLTILEVYNLYNTLLVNSRKKELLLRNILSRFNDLERKYFINILLNKLQNGIGWGVIKHSLATRYNVDVESVAMIYRRTQSIEKTIKELNGEIIGFKIGVPVMSQLALACELDEVIYPVVGEPKLDGFRAQIHIKNGAVTIFSGRNINSDKTISFPDVVQKVSGYPDGVYDGEILSIKDGKMIPFSVFQHRITAIKNLEKLVEWYPAEFIAFDLLHDGYKSMLDVPYYIRRSTVDDRVARYIPCCALHSVEEAIDFYDACIIEGYEGIMLKSYRGLYYPGEGKVGHKEWNKYKPANLTFDCLVVGARWGTGNRHDVLASFDIALEDAVNENEYCSVGSVGNGFTREMLEHLTKLILINGCIPERSEIIEKRIVLEVKTDMVLKDGFRFPRFVALRDKREIDSMSCIYDIEFDSKQKV